MIVVTLKIDLTGNTRLGPKWRSVEADCEVPRCYDADDLRRSAARYYGIPLEQVGRPRLNRRETFGREDR